MNEVGKYGANYGLITTLPKIAFTWQTPLGGRDALLL
jgi:hypothetical protein